MIVLDDANYGWILLEENGCFYLDALCSHSAVDYMFLLRLDQEEVELWRERARPISTISPSHPLQCAGRAREPFAIQSERLGHDA